MSKTHRNGKTHFLEVISENYVNDKKSKITKLTKANMIDQLLNKSGNSNLSSKITSIKSSPQKAK
jgi:hypothetical protein